MMNWADMAPHQKVFKNKRVYKWENSPGLGNNADTLLIGRF
jgi:hypothetical protein